MGLLEKFKNIFTEEVEEEVEVPVKKEVYVKKEVPKTEISLTPQVKKEAIKKEEVKQDEDPIKASNLSLKKEEKFVFPVYFDDKDFEDIKKEEPKVVKKIEKEVPTREQRKGNYQEAYNKINKEPEEKRVFKPTPIISPVYGILDKNYYKEDIVVSKPISRSSYTSSKEITIDDVRKKAFGTLEDDLESTLLSDENLNSEPKHMHNDIENNYSNDIFNEDDFANAVEEDQKRDITKDGLKSDIESLLNDEEFMKEFNYHISSKKNHDLDNSSNEKKLEEKEDTTKTSIDEDTVIEDLYEDDYSNSVDKDKTIDDLYEESNINTLDDKNDDEDNEDISLKSDNLTVEEYTDNLNNDDNESLDDLYDVKDDISDDSDDEIDNAYNSSSDLNDSDLFNLIDSMYDKESK